MYVINTRQAVVESVAFVHHVHVFKSRLFKLIDQHGAQRREDGENGLRVCGAAESRDPEEEAAHELGGPDEQNRGLLQKRL